MWEFWDPDSWEGWESDAVVAGPCDPTALTFVDDGVTVALTFTC